MRRKDYARQGSWLFIHRQLAKVAIAAACCAMAGCDSQGTGRYDLTGQVTFRGQPIPKGYMIFTPDRDKGNGGPAAKSAIVNGRYETMKGLGVVGGPHVVSIAGHDGVPYDQGDGIMNPIGRPMFPEYQAHVDLPKESGTFDFEVPATGVQ